MSPLVVASLLAVWFIWGSTYLAIKWALVSFPPFFQMGSRFLVAGAVLMAWMRWVRGARWPSRAEWLNALVLGSLMLGGGYGLTALATVSVSSGLVVAFFAIGPALQAAMEWPYGVRPAPREGLGMALGLVGMLWLASGQGFSASPWGLLWVMLASLAWKLGSVWTTRGLPQALGGRSLALAPGAMGYASQMLAGCVILLLASALAGEQPRWPLEPRAFWSWLYLVVAGSLVAFSAVMVLLQRTPTAVSSSYAYVNPIIGLLLGVWLGGEAVSTNEWLAATLVVGSVVLMLTGRR